MKRIPLAYAVVVFIALVVVSISTIEAAPSLPRVFDHHMVLQCGMPAPVWGIANAGERITVEFAGQQKHTTADADGRWLVRLDPLTPSAEPRELIITGEATLRFADVLVGEVWLCAGQSNMEMPLIGERSLKPVFDADKVIRTATFPQIRMLKIKKTRASEPASDIDPAVPWTVCSPDTVNAINFSAAGFFFGRKLHQDLNVPIGLIDSSWGGTRIESWTAPEGFDAEPSLAAFSEAARKPGVKVAGTQLCTRYNTMIHPLVPFAIRGAIWYQGESNLMEEAGGSAEATTPTPESGIASFTAKMSALVQGWRRAWQSDFPIYYVQIAPHFYHVARSAQVISADAEPRFWEAQAAALKLPRTGMVVTTDLVDDLFDIHPRNKREVGERLARWALAHDYERTDVIYSGPVFRSMEIKENKAILSFDHAHGGLRANNDKPLNWFIIAGRDGIFYPAKAEIDGERIIVSNPSVAAPDAVRFAWDEAARPNLFNGAGLPAMPFRTDIPIPSRAVNELSEK